MTTDIGHHLDLYQKLKSYLDRAIDVSREWTSWLTEFEEAVLAGQIDELAVHSQRAEELFRSMRELGSVREELLASAGTLGTKASDAKGLFRSLAEARSDELLRAKLRLAEAHMAQLKRLARAAWVLIKQCAQLTEETLRIMSLGKPHASVYIASPMADNVGGLLLDQTG